jgi:uncharacterized protein with FMN-binding domain
MSTPRNQQPIDPLLRLQQLEQRRSQPLPPPNPGARPVAPRQAPAARPAAARQGAASPANTPRPAGRPANGGVSAEASARLAALQARSAGTARPGVGKTIGGKPAGKRAKPAGRAKVASLLLSAVATGGLAGMFAHNNAQSDSIILTQGTLGTVATAATTPATAATVATIATAGTTAATTAATAATTATTAAAATTTAAAATQIADGTYVGASSSNRFGNVQVQVVYSGGQLVDVQILQYPNGDNRSVSINQYALPKLISEAVAAQSANVSSISGATYTSHSYIKSLQSAIDAAKTASGIA